MAPTAFPPCDAYRSDLEISTGRIVLSYCGFSLHNEHHCDLHGVPMNIMMDSMDAMDSGVSS